MTANAIARTLIYVAAVALVAWPVGAFMTRVFVDDTSWLSRTTRSVERVVCRVCGTRADEPMNWKRYLGALLLFNAFGTLVVYVVQRLQHWLPLNPQALPAVPPRVAINTAVSFATNTNWQAYGGETTMSSLTQMLALTSQNFLSAATGIAVVVMLARGFARRSSEDVGNFWSDLVRSTLFVLLPMSIVFALVLVALGVPQTFDGPVQSLSGLIARGPVASQIAIKQLGTNGGGFFNANAAHPFENPGVLSNFLQCVAILAIPAGLCITFGDLVGKRRQGVALLLAMFAILIPLTFAAVAAEQQPTHALNLADVDASAGNMEGKEVRFGAVDSAIWASATTAASNGSVNAMHDSFTPLGGLVPLVLMQLGEIVFGGVGSGLYGMVIYAILAVFIAGLMVGRIPEYLGKKIEAFEIKMAALVILVPAIAILIGTAVACSTSEGVAALANSGPHGFSEILYAFSSGGNNNGSAFAGLTVNGTFYAYAIAIAMLVGRFWILVPVAALAGSLARKRITPVSSGTMPTDTTLFVVLLVGTVLLVGALTFVPSLALGPVAEHLQQLGGR